VPSSRGRRSDLKIVAGATVAVLLAGFFIAGALLVATRGAKSTVCAPLRLGHASDVRKNLETQGPSFITGGGSCGFWLALDDGDIVAYKTRQNGCTLVLKRDGWQCGGRIVEAATLSRFPVTIQRIGNVDSVIVELAPPLATTTT
jgi:hypothetical protein